MPWLLRLLEELDMELVFMRRFPEAFQHWRTTGMRLLSRMQGLESYPATNGAKLMAEESEYQQAKDFLKSLNPDEHPRIGTLSKSEWEAFSMYLLFAFRKKDTKQQQQQLRNEVEQQPMSSSSATETLAKRKALDSEEADDHILNEKTRKLSP
ncbi:hypothetical protein DICVIV_10053 [Dictyocaulus viviparus]|uniref:mRNA cap 0 methyltransferase domain-containing protein n=1 Tax=Dictyocaulus viviparus TaxID=29172 RepID=A0A0D8XJI8_DICVI|nr:hypothetical protein DICVIV_10053 [Dictyocaulus viviparus]